MTPGDWQTTVKAALPNMGQYMEWKALWYDASQAQAKVNATAAGDQRDWTLDLLTGQGQYANNQTNYDWGAYAQISADVFSKLCNYQQLSCGKMGLYCGSIPMHLLLRLLTGILMRLLSLHSAG